MAMLDKLPKSGFKYALAETYFHEKNKLKYHAIVNWMHLFRMQLLSCGATFLWRGTIACLSAF